MCILERDLEIPMYLLLGILHIFAKVSQATLVEVIPQIAQRKQYQHENTITVKAMAFFLDQASKAASSFSALVPSTMFQSHCLFVK